MIRPSTLTAPEPRTHALFTRARSALLDGLNGRLHRRALLLYLVVVASHFLEHGAQIAQVYALGWARPTAGGILGLAFPGIAMAEVLHTLWNSLQLTGLIVLLAGFARHPRARPWWLVALALQSWHWFEHAVIQLQYVTGIYLYGAVKQMSILERLAPRIELHFAYNLAVFVPTVIAIALVLRSRDRATEGGPEGAPEGGDHAPS
jgi:hypothetical protein